MDESRGTVAAPVDEAARIRELDILRGVALLGVLVMNFVGFAGAGWMATEAQLAALPSAGVDEQAYFAVRWLIGDKANTVFATLFGLGFYLQLKRGQGRPSFEARYRRRLFWLLVFGWLNALFLWVWDILNLYALAGFALLAMRNWSTRVLVLFGATAASYSDKLQEWWVERAGVPVPSTEHLFTDAAVLERQAVAAAGDYPEIVEIMWRVTWGEWLVGGLMLAWVVYALGRFALGAAIGRSGILDDLPRYLPRLRRIAQIAIPAGLLVTLTITLIYLKRWQPLGDNEAVRDIAQILRSPAAILLAAGYCAGIVVAVQRSWGRALFGHFAPVGRMALTNYLAQGLLYGLVMFGVGPGLALAGKIGTSAVLLISVGFFALQAAFSRWWLARYRFGPMEWLWRALTYGEVPPMRRVEASAAAAA